jgi:transposase
MRDVRDETRATDDGEATRARLLELEAALAAERAALVTERQRAADIEAKHDRLHEAFRQLQFELELLKRRLFHAKAERIDTGQLELEFAAKLAALDTLAGELQSKEAPAGPTAGASQDDPGADGPRGAKGRPPQRRGRRDFNELDLPEERIEVPDLELDGKVERIGTEESSKVMWRRGGLCRVVFARIKYKPAVKLDLPLHRQEDRFKRLGLPIDRGTMSRWLEHAGATVGATVVHAMHADAMLHAFCILTDATGVLIQPIRDEPKGDKPRRSLQRKSCRRGHFFVQIADADHVFFEYAPKETSAAVGEMFRGFTRYIQADAKSVYDFLYRPPDPNLRCFDDDADPAACTEVGCWSHARRPIWRSEPCAASSRDTLWQ